MTTEDRIEKYATESLREIYDALLLEHFQMEFELRAIDDDTALIGWDLIIKTTPTGGDTLKRVDTIEDLADASRGKLLFGGYDVGRVIDSGELSVFLEDGNGNLSEIFFKSFHRVPFNEQEEVLRQFLSLRNARLAIDETGLGMNIAENLERSYGQRVLPVTFTEQSKMAMASTMKEYMETTVAPRHKKNGVQFIYDMNRNLQMHSIKRSVSNAGRMLLKVDPKKAIGTTEHHHHADVFWSRALGIWMHAGKTTLGDAQIRFIG